jgi:hypothetical protein
MLLIFRLKTTLLINWTIVSADIFDSILVLKPSKDLA